jgi:hypothetical protein
MAALHSELQSVHELLRTRRLDRTLTSVAPVTPPSAAPFASAAVNQVLAGGLPRGQVSEIVGPASSGRTSLAWAALAAATARGEWVALVDTFDRFDPEWGAGACIELSQLLWVRGQALSKTASAVDPAWVPGVRGVSGPGTLLERTVDRAIKALNLIVQSGVCTLVVLDLIDAPAHGLARIPRSTWLRIQRVIEGSDITVLLLPPRRWPGVREADCGEDDHTEGRLRRVSGGRSRRERRSRREGTLRRRGNPSGRDHGGSRRDGIRVPAEAFSESRESHSRQGSYNSRPTSTLPTRSIARALERHARSVAAAGRAGHGAAGLVAARVRGRVAAPGRLLKHAA